MNRVKVIKRSEAEQVTEERRHTESELRRQSNEVRRKTANTVTGWIVEWREQKEKIAADAIRELLRPVRTV